MLRHLVLTAATLAILVPFAGAQPPAKPHPAVQKILADWSELNRTVNTLECRASVESFFPRGALSAEHNQGKPPARQIHEDTPAQDTREAAGTMYWAIDFRTPRVRKDRRAVTPHFDETQPPQLLMEHSIHIFADQKYRVFRPREDNWTEADRNDKRRTQDAVFYEDRAYEFLLDFTDLPLFWLAGAVSGQLLLPSRAKLLDLESQWRYRAEGTLRGRTCHILTVPDQESKTAVLEFWVGQEPGSPIRLCRARDYGNIRWQIDAEYWPAGGRPALSTWTYTEYDFVSQRVKWSHTWRVNELTVNAGLADDLFDHRPREGMTVFQAQKGQVLEVASDGSLVPFGSSRSGHRRLLLLAAGVLLSGALLVVLIRWRRKSAPTQRQNESRNL